jgi:hypothetical protein
MLTENSESTQEQGSVPVPPITSFLLRNMAALLNSNVQGNEQQPESTLPSLIAFNTQRGERRKYVAEREAHSTVEPQQKKQRLLADIANPISLKRKYKPIGNTTGENDRGNMVLLPAAPSIDLQQYQPALSIPRHEDNVAEVIIKLTAIVDAVREGKSIAENTTGSVGSPEMIAKSQMPPLEYEAWTTFKQGLWRLPDVDWQKNQLTPPTSSKPLKIARRRAEALNRLYETDEAHEGHVVWFTQHKIEFLPMIKGMARVVGAERNEVGGGKWRAAELADLQLINRILSISTQIYQERKSEGLRSKVAETQQVLGNYRRTLRRPVLIPAS